MNLQTALLNRKKLTHNSPLKKQLYEELKNYNFSSYQEAVYIYLNKLKRIPICPFSNKNQYFNGRYVGCSKEYFNFIKHDVHVKAKWLSWENLFKTGLSLNDAEKLKRNKKLLFIRLKFSFSYLDKNKIKKVLINDGFLDDIIESLLDKDLTKIENILNFTKECKRLYSAKNNTLEYYTNRGYSLKTSKEKLYNFYNTWEKFKHIDKESERYKKWLDSRKIGLNKVRGSLRSKFEKKIYNELKNEFNINLNFVTYINSPLFSKSKFKHDFLINDKLIVEYNGTYWHKDIFTDKRFDNIDLYKLELHRAKICIENNNLKYLILWESDINQDMFLVKKLIENSLNDNKMFYSSRDIDLDLYNSL
jgi:hypothetical protein